MFHQPRGPKPTGKVPANDLPDGALRLNVGGKTSQSTRAAAVDQEADYSCMEFDDPFTPEPEVIPGGTHGLVQGGGYRSRGDR